jgi:hypothetical protein
MRRHVRRGMHLVIRELRICVKMMPPRDHIGFNLIRQAINSLDRSSQTHHRQQEDP